MKNLSAFFKIVKHRNCPLYNVDERLFLSEKTLSCPYGKEMCLILIRDLTELLFKFLQDQPFDLGSYTNVVFNCSGCTGLIKFALLQPDEVGDGAIEDSSGGTAGAVAHVAATVPQVSEKIVNYALLQNIPTDQRDVLLNHFRQITVKKGTVLIREEEIILQSYMAQMLAAMLRRTNEARARDFASCMSGRIDEIVPAELFQVFHMHQKTGILFLELQDGKAKVAFREGCIINAAYSELANEEAIFKILAEKKVSTALPRVFHPLKCAPPRSEIL